MSLVWFAALLVSFCLRLWGNYHLSPFNIRPVLVWGLVFGPSIALGFWLFLYQFRSYKV